GGRPGLPGGAERAPRPPADRASLPRVGVGICGEKRRLASRATSRSVSSRWAAFGARNLSRGLDWAAPGRVNAMRDQTTPRVHLEFGRYGSARSTAAARRSAAPANHMTIDLGGGNPPVSDRREGRPRRLGPTWPGREGHRDDVRGPEAEPLTAGGN